MAKVAKRLTYNRKTDFTDNGIFKNVNFRNDELLSDCKNGESAVFISKSFDTKINNCSWNRIKICANIPEGTSIDFGIYCSNEVETVAPASLSKGVEKINFDNFIGDNDIDFNRKVVFFKKICKKSYKNLIDILPCDLEGRYMWFFIEMVTFNTEQICIKNLRLEYPKISFTDYLPEIYRSAATKDKFLERFVGIFQSIYVDFEEKIDQISSNFDVDEMSKNFLSWVVSWLSLSDTKLWQEKKLRSLLKKIIKLYKIKGTKAAIFEIINEFCCAEPIIIEQFELKKFDSYAKHRQEIESLFGDTGHVFTVILTNKTIKNSEEYIAVLSVINGIKPIDSICNLVVLSDKFYLGHHVYLGMNSCITKNHDLILDNNEKDINTLALKA